MLLSVERVVAAMVWLNADLAIGSGLMVLEILAFGFA
jgi:hypothetical protein